MLKFLTKSRDVVAESDALPGRDEAIAVPDRHTVLGTPLVPPFPEGIEVVQFGLGCRIPQPDECGPVSQPPARRFAILYIRCPSQAVSAST